MRHAAHNIIRPNKQSSGFTLIELAIVLVIIGFFMVGLVKAYELYQIDKVQREQEAKMDKMRRALANWIRDEKCVLPTSHPDHPGGSVTEPVPGTDEECANSSSTIHLANESATGAAGDGEDAVRFPCPASPDASPGSGGYATEARDDTTETCTISANDGVIQGAFPANTVGLPSDVMVDAYGNKFTYAVSANATDPDALASGTLGGQITVVNANNNLERDDALFVLFSHGSNGGGATTREGEDAPVGATTNNEIENTDDDATFTYSAGQYRGASQYFDDTLAFSLVDEEDDEWWFSDDGGQTINHRNPGNVIMGNKPDSDVGVGTNDPKWQLHVDGNARAEVDLRAGRNVLADNNVEADNNVTAENDVRAEVDVIARNNVRADNNVRARNNVVAENHVKALEDVLAFGQVWSQNNVTAMDNVIARGDVRAWSNVTARNNVSADRNVSAGNTVTALNSVTAVNNDVKAGRDVEAGRNARAENNMYATHFFYSDSP